MVKIGLDLGTSFVKCVSDPCRFRFPSLYTRRVNGQWTNAASEAIGEKAVRMLKTQGTTPISPISKGRPDARYPKQVGLLIQESINRVYRAAHKQSIVDKAKIVVGLPYDASHHKGIVSKMILKDKRVETCDVVAQAAGTLVDLDKSSGVIVSIGQGTTEIVMIEENRVIDGQSSQWASEFITRKINRFAHLDTKSLSQNKGICSKYAKVLVENLVIEISDMVSVHDDCKQDIAVSGGGILIPNVREELISKLKGFKVIIPDDPVMSNASGLYKLAVAATAGSVK